MGVVLLPEEQAARKKEMKQLGFIVYLVVVTFLMWLAAPYVNKLIKQANEYYPRTMEAPEWVDVQYLAMDGLSRTGAEMPSPTTIVIHGAQSGLGAQQLWKLYQGDTSAESVHFIVGTDGTILQCIPLEELSSAHGMGDAHVINIALCGDAGSREVPIHQEKALAKLCAWLVEDSFLQVSDVKRHSDVAKNLAEPCPLLYASNDEQWRDFLAEVHWSITEGDWKK
jgi:N-acetylmuramoyl-L-alanine amidase CwlA